MVYPELSVQKVRFACLLLSVGIAGAQVYPGGGSPYPGGGGSPYPGGQGRPYPGGGGGGAALPVPGRGGGRVAIADPGPARVADEGFQEGPCRAHAEFPRQIEAHGREVDRVG